MPDPVSGMLLDGNYAKQAVATLELENQVITWREGRLHACKNISL